MTQLNEKVIATLSGDDYRAALACSAKNDVRYYLNGVLLSAEHSEIVGTDGHTLFVGKLATCDLSEDLILETPKVPLNVTEVEIKVYPGEAPVRYRMTTRTERGDVKEALLRVIDGRFPDYKAILGSKKQPAEPYTDFCFNADLLARVRTVFGKNSFVQFSAKTKHTAFTVRCKKMPDSLLVVMPGKY